LWVYVAQSDAKHYNKSSQVVLARDGDRTVETLSNDYEGDLEEFALVVPVPVVPKRTRSMSARVPGSSTWMLSRGPASWTTRMRTHVRGA
jgi:hypothetical protein